MLRSPLRTAAAVAALAAFVAVPASASDVAPAASAGVPATPQPPKLVVLRDGHVIEGTIRFAQGGYEVDKGGGRVFLADAFVWFTAADRREAYEELRSRLPDTTANGHVSLAQWCVTNRLYASAQDELRIALRMEPDHAAARATLKMLDETLKTGEAAPAAHEAASASEDAPTLGGLPPDLARRFVTSVQPILVNRCGNAACHGAASKSEFQLKNVRGGNAGFRSQAIANLDAVRARISAADPMTSPLLVAPQQPNHGRSRRPVFAGPAGEAQRKAIADWVAAAAKTLPPSDAATVSDADPIPLIGAEVERPSTDSAVVTTADAETVTTASSEDAPATRADPTSDLLQRVLAEERPDAFDPDEFNRRYGPQADRPPVPSNDGPTR